MSRMDCMALVLAGGRGERLGLLTEDVPKPAVDFGGGNRLIDYTLGNCIHAGVERIGILAQYQAKKLEGYVTETYQREESDGYHMDILLPWKQGYVGTADAVYQNIDYIDHYSPKYVMILSSDHVYKMDYIRFVKSHIRKQADLSIAVTPVAWSEVSRFGIVRAADDGEVTHFIEKPSASNSNLASMGIYIFNWPTLRSLLVTDHAMECSHHDFGKDIIPTMVSSASRVFAYPFHGYWSDVGTLDSYWQANLDLIRNRQASNLHEGWQTYCTSKTNKKPILCGFGGIENTIFSGSCFVHGIVKDSVINQCSIGRGSLVTESVIMPYACIGENVILHKAIVGPGAKIGSGVTIDARRHDTAVPPWPSSSMDVTLIGPDVRVFPQRAHMAGTFA